MLPGANCSRNDPTSDCVEYGITMPDMTDPSPSALSSNDRLSIIIIVQ